MDTNPVAYWNEQARDYDENIFSTIDEDHTGIITRTLDRCAAPHDEGLFGRCIDLGCGAGKYLPALAARFRSVSAYDLSPKLVALANKEVKGRSLQNVVVQVRDLSQVWYRGEGSALGDNREMESYGFAVMANVLIAPVEEQTRQLMLRNAYRSLCPGGRLLVVVPSLESTLYVNMRCAEVKCDGSADLVKMPTRAVGQDVLNGVMRRSGVRTKHFLEPEFCLLANRVGFGVVACEKVLYTWRSELGFDSELQVPAAMKDTPLPWDWLFLLQRGDGPSAPVSSSAAPLWNVPAIDLDLSDRHGHQVHAAAGISASTAPTTSFEQPASGAAASTSLPAMGSGPYSSRGPPPMAPQMGGAATSPWLRDSDAHAQPASAGLSGGASSGAPRQTPSPDLRPRPPQRAMSAARRRPAP